jgi:hypothetical protein
MVEDGWKEIQEMNSECVGRLEASSGRCMEPYLLGFYFCKASKWISEVILVIIILNKRNKRKQNLGFPKSLL